jgi:hypothetical protein
MTNTPWLRVIKARKGFEYIRAIIARWVVLNIAYRIHRLAVIEMCLEVSKMYTDSIEIKDDNND